MSVAIDNPVGTQRRDGIAPSARLFTVREYYHLAEVGIFNPDERVELIKGEILVMSPQGPRHASATTRANNTFGRLLGESVVVRTQAPIHIDKHSEPEPDVTLAIPDLNEYSDHHPAPKEILFVMEISEATLDYDRTTKSRLYAKAGIIQYCILNIKTRELEDYRSPGPAGFRSKKTYKANKSFSLVAFPDVRIKVSDLLPPSSTSKRTRKRVK